MFQVVTALPEQRDPKDSLSNLTRTSPWQELTHDELMQYNPWAMVGAMVWIGDENCREDGMGQISSEGKMILEIFLKLESCFFFLGCVSATGYLLVWGPVVWIPGIPPMKGIVT